MNGLELVLTWTLVHSLWISLAALLLVNIATALFRQSKIRRVIKISAISLFCLAVFAIFLKQINHLSNFESAQIIGLQFANADTATPTWLDTLKLWVSTNSLIISAIWILGILFGLLRFFGNRHALAKCKTTALPCSHTAALNNMYDIRQRLNIKRNVRLMVSSLLDSPMTIGIIKPIIYLPAGLISGFNSAELDTILLHELSHIKRHDYLVNLCLVFVETLFFFNPVVLFMVKDLRSEMEFVCDDEVLESHNQLAYARVLVKLQEINISNQVAMAAKNNQSEFKNRIERMINQNNTRISSKLGLVVLLFTALLVSSAFMYNSPEEAKEISPILAQEQDTLKVKDAAELTLKIREMDSTTISNTLILMDGKPVKVIKSLNNALKKADLMMEEVHEELVKDGILNQDKQKITLMFQYSDVLNGEAALGDKYEKYKDILNKYFPRYDSFATTRVFRYQKEN